MYSLVVFFCNYPISLASSLKLLNNEIVKFLIYRKLGLSSEFGKETFPSFCILKCDIWFFQEKSFEYRIKGVPLSPTYAPFSPHLLYSSVLNFVSSAIFLHSSITSAENFKLFSLVDLNGFKHFNFPYVNASLNIFYSSAYSVFNLRVCNFESFNLNLSHFDHAEYKTVELKKMFSIF